MKWRRRSLHATSFASCASRIFHADAESARLRLTARQSLRAERRKVAGPEQSRFGIENHADGYRLQQDFHAAFAGKSSKELPTFQSGQYLRRDSAAHIDTACRHHFKRDVPSFGPII